MNLKEERSYQKALEILDLMELSEENYRLGEQYLDTVGTAEPILPEKIARQDFAALDKAKAEKCREYISHLRKRGRTKELERYVRFAAAVGGSTAYYLLISYGWNLALVREFLTDEQAAAIQAEAIVWNRYGLRNAMSHMEQKNPDILRRAMRLCSRKAGNAQTLLAAAALYHTRGGKRQGGLLKGLFTPKKPETETRNLISSLETNLIDSISNLFTGASPSGEEIHRLQDFVRNEKTDGPFSEELYAVLRGRQTSEYLILLLSGTAFLAVEHSDRCVNFLRLATAIDAQEDRTTTLNICAEIGGEDWFQSHIEDLEELLLTPKKTYVHWCLENKQEKPLGRLIRKYPDAVRSAWSEVTTEGYLYFMTEIEKYSPQLYRELAVTGEGEYRRTMAQELTARYDLGRLKAQQYLLGEADLEEIIPFVPQWRKEKRYYAYDYQRKIAQLRGNSREQQMLRRAMVLEGLCMRVSHFNYLKGNYHKVDKDGIREIMEIFDREKVPPVCQLEMLGAIHDSFYLEKDKTAFINHCVMALCPKRREWEEVFIKEASEGAAILRFLCIRVLDVYWKEYRDVLLSCASDNAKQVRELLAAVYESHREWEPEMKTMLASKKSGEREMAVLVLKKWGAETYRSELEAAYEGEKSKKIRALLEESLGLEKNGQIRKDEGVSGSGQEGISPSKRREELAKEILKGGKKRKVSWAFDGSLPQVHRLDGRPADEDYLAAVLVSYADMGTPGLSRSGADLALDLDLGELSEYMCGLFGKWLEGGAEAKKKWVLYAVSIHGGEPVIPLLHGQIQEWPKVSRGAMAAEAVKALALNGSSTALLLVDQISRKFKFRQVKTAAGEALSSAARELGITRQELEDRIVPDLGFDEKMERSFDYGSRSFKVTLTPALELLIYDEEGKKLKNLPAPGKRDDPDKSREASGEFKLLKKQLKTVAANQKLRLEQALCGERLWQVTQWKELFVKNPVMHQFAIGLIWGLYERAEEPDMEETRSAVLAGKKGRSGLDAQTGAVSDHRLKKAFRYMEDGSFNTIEGEDLAEEEFELPEEGQIGLVHPIELEEALLAAWKEQLSDYEVVQPIEQLERPVYRLTEEESSQKELTRFGGKLLNGLSLSGKLQNQGWYRGSVQDAGGYYTFYREDGEIGAELEFSGCFVGDENEEVTVYGAQFYRAGTVTRGSYVYDTVKEKDRYLLSQVSRRYFSEVVLQLTRATASSQEQLPYPECKGK